MNPRPEKTVGNVMNHGTGPDITPPIPITARPMTIRRLDSSLFLVAIQCHLFVAFGAAEVLTNRIVDHELATVTAVRFRGDLVEFVEVVYVLEEYGDFPGEFFEVL